MRIRAGGKPIRQEKQIELAGLRDGGDVLQEFQVLPASLRLSMPPAAHMVAGRLDEDAQMHAVLASFGSWFGHGG